MAVPSGVVVPDGGLAAWFVVFSAFIMFFQQQGFSYSFGVLVEPISQVYQTGRADISIISSILMFLSNGSALVAIFLVRRLSHRSAALLGTALSGTGLLVAGISVLYLPPYIWILYITVSIL